MAASGAFAQAPPPIAPDSLTLERLPLDEADLLTRADARAAQGRFDDASEVYLLLLDMAWGPLADAIVEVPGQPDLFEGLAPAIRRRLARWPARGLATWRARVDGKAKGLYEHALATADEAAREAALEEVCRRFPFAEASANAALRRADDALEQGDLATALSRIALARAYGATAEAERRQAVVERALGAARPPAAPAHGWLPAPAPGRAGPPGDPVPGPGLEATPPPGWRRTDLASSRPGASSRSAPALAGVVGLRAPYRLGVAHLRGVALLREDGAPRLIPPGAGRVDAGTSIIRLGAAETSSALIASVPSEVASAGAAPPHRAAAAAGVSGRASAVQRRRDRLLDAQLMAFDLERDGALVWSTADPERFGEDAAAWLGAVLWCGGVDARYGAVAASGLAPRAALEVVLAGFDARRPHLRWRRFICAAGQPRREHELTHAPRVAIAGHVAVLDSGLGVRAGVDVVTGEVLWLRMPTTYAPADPLAPRTQVVYPRAPALFAPSPAVAFGRVVSEDRVRGLVEGLDAATGAVVWRASSAGWSAGLVGGCGEWVALVDPDGLWLVDVRTGRALTAKLPLPPDVSVSSAVAGAGRFLAVPISKGPREAFSDLLILEVVEVFEAIGVAGKPAALALELVGAFEAPSGGAGPAILHDGALAYLAGPDAIVHPPAREAARGDLSPLGHAVGLYRVEVDGMVAARTLRSLGRWARLVEGVSRARVRRERGEVHLVLDAARERTVAVVRRADGSLGVRVAPANGSERAESTAPGGWGTGADRRPPRKAVPTTTRPRYED